MAIIIKSPSEIAAMRRAGMVVASILKVLSKEIRSGMTTAQLDDITVRELTGYEATPSFKGYRGLAHHHHPDKHSGATGQKTEETMKRLNWAYKAHGLLQ